MTRVALKRIAGRADLVVCIATVGGLLLATLVPQDVLTRVDSLRSFATAMSALVPSIGNLAASSAFPEVTELYFSVMWLLVPIQAIALYRIEGALRVEPMLVGLRTLVRSPVFAHAGLLLLLLSLALVPFFIMGEGQDPTSGWLVHEVAARLMSNSRVALGILGSALLSVVAVAVSLLLKWLTFVVSRTTNRGAR